MNKGQWKLELTSPDGIMKGVELDAPANLKEFPRMKDNNSATHERFQARLRAITKENKEFEHAFQILLSAFHPTEE